MLNLVGTTDALKMITANASVDCDWAVSWVDSPTPILTSSNITPDSDYGATTGAGTATIAAAPGSGVCRNIKFFSMRNRDTADTQVVTMQVDVSGTLYQLIEVTLLPDEVLVFSDGTWFHFDTNGGVYGQALPVASDTVVGGIEIATQAEMESNSSNTLAVTPGRMKYHPGVAKAVLFTTGTATPVASTPPTYNCTLTDTNVGRLTVNFTVAFASATAYTVQVNVEIISTTLTAAANVMQGYMRFGGQAAAGSCEVNCCDRTATTNVIRDPISWHIVAYGDQ